MHTTQAWEFKNNLNILHDDYALLKYTLSLLLFFFLKGFTTREKKSLNITSQCVTMMRLLREIAIFNNIHKKTIFCHHVKFLQDLSWCTLYLNMQFYTTNQFVCLKRIFFLCKQPFLAFYVMSINVIFSWISRKLSRTPSSLLRNFNRVTNCNYSYYL